MSDYESAEFPCLVKVVEILHQNLQFAKIAKNLNLRISSEKFNKLDTFITWALYVINLKWIDKISESIMSR